jgi:DNA-binding LacI/PurR family transcriptional regulator
VSDRRNDRPPNKGRVSIKDVAEASSVSTATVSLIMNGKGRIAESTRTQVLETAAKLGYRPSAAAVALATGRANAIALAFSRAHAHSGPLTEIEYYERAIRSATTQALLHNYVLIISPPGLPPEAMTRVPIDGLVVLDPIVDDPITAAHAGRNPVVTIGRPSEHADAVGIVDNDHIAGTKVVLDHLEASGCPQPSLIVADSRDSFTRDCVEGYRQWCGEHSAAVAIETVVSSDHAAVYAAMDRLAAGAAEFGVYANGEYLSLVILQWAADNGVRVPDDMKLVACSDRTDFSGVSVSLTTLELDAVGLAAAAIEMLVRGVGDPEIARRQEILPTRLRVRDSTRSTRSQRGRKQAQRV